jgi:hypothetical protein
MKEMSYEACQLVDAGREAFRPTEADRARLMTAITGAATLSVGMAAAAGVQRPVSSARWAASSALLTPLACWRLRYPSPQLEHIFGTLADSRRQRCSLRRRSANHHRPWWLPRERCRPCRWPRPKSS